MWWRFTEDARRAVYYAQREAELAAHSYVASEHILLGLTREREAAGDGPDLAAVWPPPPRTPWQNAPALPPIDRTVAITVRRLLDAFRLAPEHIVAETERAIEPPVWTGKEMNFLPDAKRAIDLAFGEARRVSDQRIGPEHLLLGILREPDGLGGQVLRRLGLTADAAQRGLDALRVQSPLPPPTPPWWRGLFANPPHNDTLRPPG